MINTILLSINEVKQITTISTATIYRLMAENKFPKSINILGRRVAWVESEIEEWIDTKVAQNRINNQCGQSIASPNKHSSTTLFETEFTTKGGSK